MFSPEGFVLISCTILLVVQPGHGSEIFGGKEVKPHSMPYMALVRNPTGMCGGTLINPKWVLTAAHCEKMTTVALGVHSIKQKQKESWQEFKVTRNISHPAFNIKTGNNDLMLLELETAAKETKNVKYLPLESPKTEPTTGTSCVTAGWGLTNVAVMKPSDVLMSVTLTVVDRKECSKYYSSVITKAMICAGSENKDTCQGDSGGPLLCNGVLVGVTSFSHRRGRVPGVYAYITEEHLRWIKNIIRTSEMQE